MKKKQRNPEGLIELMQMNEGYAMRKDDMIRHIKVQPETLNDMLKDEALKGNVRQDYDSGLWVLVDKTKGKSLEHESKSADRRLERGQNLREDDPNPKEHNFYLMWTTMLSDSQKLGSYSRYGIKKNRIIRDCMEATGWTKEDAEDWFYEIQPEYRHKKPRMVHASPWAMGGPKDRKRFMSYLRRSLITYYIESLKYDKRTAEKMSYAMVRDYMASGEFVDGRADLRPIEVQAKNPKDRYGTDIIDARAGARAQYEQFRGVKNELSEAESEELYSRVHWLYRGDMIKSYLKGFTFRNGKPIKDDYFKAYAEEMRKDAVYRYEKILKSKRANLTGDRREVIEKRLRKLQIGQKTITYQNAMDKLKRATELMDYEKFDRTTLELIDKECLPHSKWNDRYKRGSGAVGEWGAKYITGNRWLTEADDVDWNKLWQADELQREFEKKLDTIVINKSIYHAMKKKWGARLNISYVQSVKTGGRVLWTKGGRGIPSDVQYHITLSSYKRTFHWKNPVIKQIMKDAVMDWCVRNQVALKSMQVDDQHTHILVRAFPDKSPEMILKQIKKRCNEALNKEEAYKYIQDGAFKKKGSSKTYEWFGGQGEVESAGGTNIRALQKYIDDHLNNNIDVYGLIDLNIKMDAEVEKQRQKLATGEYKQYKDMIANKRQVYKYSESMKNSEMKKDAHHYGDIMMGLGVDPKDDSVNPAEREMVEYINTHTRWAGKRTVSEINKSIKPKKN